MPNEHADKAQGRDQHVTRTVHVDVGRAAGGVHVDGPADQESMSTDQPDQDSMSMDKPHEDSM